MSYANRQQMGSNRTVSIIVVALLHIVLGYALVTGLAYNVLKKAASDLKTFDVTEPPPPPEEKPPPEKPKDPAPGKSSALPPVTVPTMPVSISVPMPPPGSPPLTAMIDAPVPIPVVVTPPTDTTPRVTVPTVEPRMPPQTADGRKNP